MKFTKDAVVEVLTRRAVQWRNYAKVSASVLERELRTIRAEEVEAMRDYFANVEETP
jgi:hypothetical protein